MGKNIYKEPLSAFDRPQHHVLRNLYCALYGVPPLLTGCCSQIPSRSANARHCGACSKRVPGSDCIGSRNVRLLTGCCSQIPSRSANARHCGACSKRVPGSDRHCQLSLTALAAGVTGFGSSMAVSVTGDHLLEMPHVMAIASNAAGERLMQDGRPGEAAACSTRHQQSEHVAVVPAIFSPKGKDPSGCDNRDVCAHVGSHQPPAAWETVHLPSCPS
uniref:Uncharacterized protein n=1 Tax=Molossus molossus TaxID=27622 RepID=A0A7J8F905_MOLMO|nr:hypothetical protein HJG59_008517 [Molossus molossus]